MAEPALTGKTSILLRYEKVFSTLIRFGFEDILSHPPFNKILPQTGAIVPSRKGRKVSEFTRNERIRLVCEELGTTFIKFAQIASNRPDLLPEDLIAELEKLQDHAPVVPQEVIMQTITQELKRPIAELLEYIDETPLASASMAQVHRAKLIGGKEVVLKIQRPNIQETIAADISILKHFVSIIDYYFPEYNVYQPNELVKMFEKSINEELNFRIEASNLRQFTKMFKSNPDVYVPLFYEELSSGKILCLEYVKGYKITDLEALKNFGITGKELALKGIGLYYEQVFDHGFFHADPHPGNILILENSQIAFIDFGMMGTVIESDKIIFANLLLSMYNQDVKELKKSILKFTASISEEKERELEYDIMYFFRNYTDIAIEKLDGEEVMKGLNALFYDYKIKIPAPLLLLLKALIIIEGVGLKLDPNYDIIKNIGPYVQKLFIQKLDFKAIQKSLLKSTIGISNLVNDLPDDINTIIKKIKEGQIHIEFEHKGLEPITKTSEIVVNRLSFSFVIAALILASSIIVHADFHPKTYGISSLGLIGFIVSGILIIRLLYSIRKHGNF